MKKLSDISFACIGHRGASGHAPENTLKSFALARSMGCPWIELDVYNVDGTLIVIHDDTVNRTTNGTGKVMDLSLEALRQLDAGDGEKIPLLSEVTDLVDARMGINIELKGPGTAGALNVFLDHLTGPGAQAGRAPGVPQSPRLAHSTWTPDHFLVSSFNHAELAKVSSRYSRAPLFGRTGPYLDVARSLDAVAVNLSLTLATRTTVAGLHDAGYRVYVYTVNALSDIKLMCASGVDGIFTNYPDRVTATR